MRGSQMMAMQTMTSFLVLSLSFLLQSYSVFADRKAYIVYLGGHSHSRDEISAVTDEKVINSHHEFLGSFLESKEKAQDAIFYSYTKYINGFAAILEDEEAMEISKHPKVVSIFPSKWNKLHTTHSWEFLGLERNGIVLSQSLWKKARFGEDVIIGNLDTGVWPESPSFRDDGLGPIPSRWKGTCVNDYGKKFPCNRKLIGARYFNKGYLADGGKLNKSDLTPRDVDGHGSHTLSTAGGAPVANASIFGQANGTARGGSPKARVAAYKVCWGTACLDPDILAAFEAAIHDGVDVLSVSLGPDRPMRYFEDTTLIGSFHAVEHGITVVCSAGNEGPWPGSVKNTAPWIFTVGANRYDREFASYIEYDNKRIKGHSLSSTSLPAGKLYPLISSTDAKASNASLEDARYCAAESLDPRKVKGKIIVCSMGLTDILDKDAVVLQSGGAGIVVANLEELGDLLGLNEFVLPATQITYSDGVELFSYLKSNKSAYGSITKPATLFDVKPAPAMVGFSSVGPNMINPEILKPDITAPGVDILAAWSMAVGPSDDDDFPDARRSAYNVASGTSMSCPHIAGVVGLLKTLHPDWSHAAIRSAIMTSASVNDNTHNPITNSSGMRATPFDYGSGHVNPNRAMDPGLVYDLTVTDYLDFLCANGYNSSLIKQVSNESCICPSSSIKLEDLNYPSIAVPRLSSEMSVTRTVRNVGSPGTYVARVVAPESVSVEVKPAKLKFSKIGEERKFELIFKPKGRGPTDYVFGSLVWSDGKHHVRSPIVVKS